MSVWMMQQDQMDQTLQSIYAQYGFFNLHLDFYFFLQILNNKILRELQ